MSSASENVSALQRQIDFTQFLNAIMSGHVTRLDDRETPPWFETAKTYEIPEEMFWFFLELAPQTSISPSMFAYEDSGAFRLCWEKRHRYFARELTREEAELFCRLGRVARDS